MSIDAGLEARRQTDWEQAVLSSYSELRSSFIQGLHGDLHADIPAPGFIPPQMPTCEIVRQMLIADAGLPLLVDLLRVLVRAAEARDPVLCGKAQKVIAHMARDHGTLHREEHAGRHA